MTGFQVPRTTYKLVFDDDAYAGLEIKVRGTTLDELFALDEATEALNTAKTLDEGVAAIRARNGLFVEKVIGWNLEEDGQPVPVSVEALGTFESAFTTLIVATWRRAAAGVVPAPLVQPSTDGDLSQVESTLMAIPTESLAS